MTTHKHIFLFFDIMGNCDVNLNPFWNNALKWQNVEQMKWCEYFLDAQAQLQV